MSHTTNDGKQGETSRSATDLGESLALMRRAQAGEDDALNALLTRYQERILHVIRARIGPALRQRLETFDIMQQVLVTATRCYERFDVSEEASLIHWLARIAENEIMRQADYFGRQKRSPAREEPVGEHRIDPGPSPSGVARQNEQNARLEQALDQLTVRQRELILQRDYLGGSWASIAKDLGYGTAESARVSHSRALLALGKRLHKEGDA